MTTYPVSVSPCSIVVFGAGGDLGKLKIFPALAKLDAQGWLPPETRVLAVSRREVDHGEFTDRIMGNIDVDADAGQRLRERVIVVDGADPAKDTGKLAAALAGIGDQRRLFYCATPPSQFGPIATALADAGLISEESPIVLEKPLGTDLDSYQALNSEVSRSVAEHQIYRIDHYLGKETVQNILCLRFANLIFESLWNRNHIDHVQITVAETLGVAGRAGYYENAGAIRDMIQNHLAQLLCLVAMEQPREYEADCVRDEKLKVLQSLAPLAPGDVVTGQYGAGLVEGEKVASYAEDVDNPDSRTESFAALRVMVNNWRWSGVPFYLRTGKRLPKRESLIVVNFKEIPHSLFGGSEQINQVVIRLQPNEGVTLLVNNKIPGPGNVRLRINELNLNFADGGGGPLPDSYERLLLDALRSNPTLYMRNDEVEASWRWIEPVLGERRPEIEPYKAGTWGPDAAQFLLAGSGRRWLNPREDL